MKTIFSILKSSSNSFDGQEEDENVILLLRRHPFVIIIKLLAFGIFAILPIVLAVVLSSFLNTQELFGIFVFASSIYYLILWSLLFYSLTMYTLDVWMVTNKRVIDSTQHGFFNRNISELHLFRIQDITVKIHGVIETILKFGDLHIQTAGTEERFRFLQIPKPVVVKDEIIRQVSNNHGHHNSEL